MRPGRTGVVAMMIALSAAAEAGRVVVFSASPSGIAAAVAARRASKGSAEALVLEPGLHVGGMMAGGMLDDSTQGQPRVYAGIAREAFQRLARSKGHTGANQTCYSYLPSEIEAVWRGLASDAGVSVTTNATICSAAVAGAGTAGARIASVRLCNGSTVEGDVFVDASYEGDLLALAGAPFALGREGRGDWNESFAGVQLDASTSYGFQSTKVDPWTVPGDSSSGPLPLVCNGVAAGCAAGGGAPGSADGRVQSFNLRACVASGQAGPAGPRVPVERPAGFNASRWELLRRYAVARYGADPDAAPSGLGGGVSGFMGCHSSAAGACDTNDQGPISLNQIGWQWPWPTASWGRRAELLREHIDYSAGLISWLAQAKEVPSSVRKAAADVALCGWQFNGTAHWPWMTYVREGRRLQGAEVLTQQDYSAAVAAGLPAGRSGLGGPLNASVGLAFWFLDSHEVQRVPAPAAGAGGGPAAVTANEGDIQFGRDLMDAGATMGIPYGVMVTAAPGHDGRRAHAALLSRAAAGGHATTSQEHAAAGFSRMLLSPGHGGGAVAGGLFREGPTVPGALGNLLVSVCVSSTHVGFNSLRVEPTFQVMGQAAGTAAALALRAGSTVQDVDLTALQAELRAAGAIVTRDDMARLPPPADAC